MRRLLHRILSIADRALDVVIWLHDAVMLYICLVWLLPLVALALVSLLIHDLRPAVRERADELVLLILLGFPLWLGLCLYAELAAPRLREWLRRAPARVGLVFLVGGGLFWMLSAL